ncbi:hypothetical protein NC653_038279 [Populus alba x Populus x berolinensis]|uniref:Uncharacterized protein n=1 Tax=Populus alba x Populus x berolinensis TaxID=444605 RepID=A0AAD6PUM4_9ROSI|nr:hypothetical protein NC653_038279 [Populus alba x Populus x berolinensis]
MGSLLTTLLLLRLWETLRALALLRSLLLLPRQLISRLQPEFMEILRTITSGQMDRTVATLSRIDPPPRFMLPLVVDLPWATCLAVAGTDLLYPLSFRILNISFQKLWT